MGRWNKWTFPLLGAGVVLLSLWGWWGVGTASQLFPEKREPPRAAAQKTKPREDKDEGETPEDALVRRYDASTHLRSHPLKDPFHAEAAGKREVSENKEDSAPPAVSSPGTGTSPVRGKRERQKAPPAVTRPVLKGIMAYGDKRRALVEAGGETYTAAEGEQAGTWTIVHIGDKSVDLAAGPDTLHLSL